MNCLQEALYFGNHTEVRNILRRESLDVNIAFADGNIPFFEAIDTGDANIVQEMLQYSNVDISLEYDGYTALSYACMYKNMDIVRMQQLHTNDPEVQVNYTNINNVTALHIAVENNHLEQVLLLLTYTRDIYLQTSSAEKNILHIAVEQGYLPIIKQLVEIYQYPQTIKTAQGDTLMHLSCKEGRIPIQQYLLGKVSTAWTEELNVLGQNPIDLLLQYKHIDTQQWLCTQQYACMYTNEQNQSLLQIAVANNYIQLVQVLITTNQQKPHKDLIDIAIDRQYTDILYLLLPFMTDLHILRDMLYQSMDMYDNGSIIECILKHILHVLSQ